MEYDHIETRTDKGSNLLQSLAIICSILIASIAPYAIVFALKVPIYGWTQVFYYFVALVILPFLAVVGVVCGVRLVEHKSGRLFGMTLGSVSIGLCAFVLLQWVKLDPLIWKRIGVPRPWMGIVGSVVLGTVVFIIATFTAGSYRRKPATHILLFFSSVCVGISAFHAIEYLPRSLEHGHDLNALYRYPTEDLLDAPAPPFTLRTLRGGTYNLGSDGGKVILVNFWATWCGPCIREMPDLEKFHHEFRDSPVGVLALSTDSDTTKVKPFIDSLGYTFTTLYVTGEVFDAYRIQSIPTTYILDKKGIIRKVMVGYNEDVSPGTMRSAIRKLLDE